MYARCVNALLLAMILASNSAAQGMLRPQSPPTASGWRPVGQPQVTQTQFPQTGRSVASAPQPVGNVAKVTEGMDMLPRTAGQVWRNYDISPFTRRAVGLNKPEQLIVDWILRETGTEIWFSNPLGILSATPDTLRVYHTPEVQGLVHDIVDRFVHDKLDSHVVGLRLVTIGSPNWRSMAYPMLRQVDVQTPGIQAWLISKENAAILLGQLRKRNDFQEQHAPNVWIPNGSSQTIERRRPRSFVQSLRWREPGWPQYELQMGKFDEGYSLNVSPLMSRDGSTMEVVIQCHVDQVEKLQPVNIDLPAPNGQAQRVTIQVPQAVSWRLHERFRWPADQILLLSCGVVATPGPEKNNLLGIFDSSRGRADALLFVEVKPTNDRAILRSDPRTSAVPLINSRGRY